MRESPRLAPVQSNGFSTGAIWLKAANHPVTLRYFHGARQRYLAWSLIFFSSPRAVLAKNPVLSLPWSQLFAYATHLCHFFSFLPTAHVFSFLLHLSLSLSFSHSLTLLHASPPCASCPPILLRTAFSTLNATGLIQRIGSGASRIIITI